MSTLAYTEKKFITRTLVEFQKGQLTLREAAARLLTETRLAEVRRARSDHRLKRLCGALQRERGTAKLRELKRSLQDEFYQGDQVASCQRPRGLARDWRR